WAGGPKAVKLGRTDTPTLIRQALASLQTLFGRLPESDMQLEAGFVHDWQQDPFARGAYSYVCVGGQNARAQLAEPVKETLFFAGEASDTEGEAGTVAGAIQSGIRAAHQLLAGGSARVA